MGELDKKLTSFFGDAFHKRVFMVCLVVAISLIIASFFIPPLAVVDGSVLAAVGEIFAFAALGEVAAAIERGHTATISHGNTQIEIRNDEGKKHRRKICEEQYEEKEEEDGTDIT